MSSVGRIVLVDTTVFLNVLDVPGRNVERDAVLEAFGSFIEEGASLLLPVVAVVETGNHIARLPNGGERRSSAQAFVQTVEQALKGQAPWNLVQFPNNEILQSWLCHFPDSAMQEVSFVDFTIIREWQRAVERYPMSRVMIWSLDHHLQGYKSL